MATDKKQLGIRFNDERYAYIEQVANKLGLKKNAVVEMMVDFHRSHTQSVSTLVKTNDSNGFSLNRGVSTLDKSVSTLKGLDAKAVILEAKKAWLSDGSSDRTQVLFHAGAIWLMGKNANGTQDVLKKLIDFPEDLFEAMVQNPGSYSLVDCKAALVRQQELASMDYIDVVVDKWGESYLDSFWSRYLFTAGGYSEMLSQINASIAACKEAMEESTAAVEVVIDEMPSEAIEVPSTPLLKDAVAEPTPMTGKQFKDKYQLDPGSSYGVACQQGKDGGWTAPDSLVWFYDTKAKQWSTEQPVVAQLELALGSN